MFRLLYKAVFRLKLKRRFDIQMAMSLKYDQPDTSMSQTYFIGVKHYMFRAVFPSIIRS